MSKSTVSIWNNIINYQTGKLQIAAAASAVFDKSFDSIACFAFPVSVPQHD